MSKREAAQSRTAPGFFSTLNTQQADRGATLMELLVVIAITTVIAALVLSTVLIVLNIASRINEQNQDRLQVELTFEEMEQTLSGATVSSIQHRGQRINEAHDYLIEFWSHAGAGLTASPRRFHYRVERKSGKPYYELKEWSFKTGKWRVMLSGLENSRIFSYYTWSTLAGSGAGSSSCFKPIPFQGGQIADLNKRNQILGILVKLDYRNADNVNAKGYKKYTRFIPLIENNQVVDEHNNTVTNIPASCWEHLESLGA